MKQYLKEHPIKLAFILLGVCLLLRLNDIFVLKIDEAWGEIIISKFLGFVLILGCLYYIKEKFATIGLHRNQIGLCIIIGFGVNLLVYLIAYITEYIVLAVGNQNPEFILAAIDPKQGVTGSVLFALWLIVGNVVNALMEEGLFRGVFLPAFKSRYTFWKANMLQALLFGVWHLVWPLKYYLSGQQSLMGAVMNGVVLLLGTCTFAVVWGYMFEKTNSLWTPIAAHFIANTIQNILHVQSTGGLDMMVALRGTVASLVGLASILIVKWLASKYKCQNLKAWAIQK
ncbi:MAG: lysostaphin resistance A-like protein [Cellulosilyticaceae bacterium]